MITTVDANRAPASSLHDVARQLSFCHRHNLRLCLLAIHLKDMTTLESEIGKERVHRLQQDITYRLNQNKRLEDALIYWQAGQVVLSLPGTSVSGARALAQRLERWFAANDFHIDEYQVCLDTRMGLHCTEEEPCSVQVLIDEALALLQDAAIQSGPMLSDRARHHLDEEQVLRETPPLTDQLAKLIRSGDTNRILDTLAPALSNLDEPLRLQLVDTLLEASLHPQPPFPGH